jgi:hypothetical protein
MIRDIEGIPPVPPHMSYTHNQQISQDIVLAQRERRVLTIPCSNLTSSLLDALWSAEDPFPILVTGANKGLQLDWDPPFFSRTFYEYLCCVEDCSSGVVSEITVDQFFSHYDQDSGIEAVLRMRVCTSLRLLDAQGFMFNS